MVYLAVIFCYHLLPASRFAYVVNPLVAAEEIDVIRVSLQVRVEFKKSMLHKIYWTHTDIGTIGAVK